jgi:hypothetical protein
VVVGSSPWAAARYAVRSLMPSSCPATGMVSTGIDQGDGRRVVTGCHTVPHTATQCRQSTAGGRGPA